jgi:hypothetical protein
MHLEIWRVQTPERSFAIVNELHGVLFLRHVASEASRPQVAISYARLDAIDLSSTAKRLGTIHGCLGLLHSPQGGQPASCVVQLE